MARPLVVLLIDDQPFIGELVKRLIGSEPSIALNACHDAGEAIARAHDLAPDVILLDLMMPVMDGWEFRRRQVADPTIATVPVVVLSAVDPARAGDLGGAAFLKKPLDFDQLLALVRRFCAPTG